MGNCNETSVNSKENIEVLPKNGLSQEIQKVDQALLKKKERSCFKNEALFLRVKRPRFLRSIGWSCNQELGRRDERERKIQRDSHKVMRYVKRVKNFPYKPNFVSDNKCSKMIKTFKHTPCINNLTLDFSYYEISRKIVDAGIVHISKHLKVLKNVKGFSMKLPQRWDYFSIPMLLSSFKTHRQLRSIEIDFTKLTFSRKIQMFATLFQSLSHIQAFSNLLLDFTSVQDIDSTHFSSISKGISQLRLLSVLSISFKECSEFSDQDVEFLCSSLLEHANSLTKLNLNLSYCSKLTDNGLKSLGLALKRFLHLTSLTLDFSDCRELTTPAIKLLLQELQTLPVISALDLSFCKIKGVSSTFISIISPELASFKLQKSLKLSLRDIPKILTTEPLSLALQKQATLQDLFLDFGSNDLNDSAIQSLCIAIKQMTNLKALSLSFEKNEQIGDRSPLSLASTIPNLKQLISLSLSFAYCRHITNSGIRDLSFAIQKMNSLRTINLNFAFCRRWINDASVQLIADSLCKLPLLSELNLNFVSCYVITTDGIKFLTETIEALESLNIVRLGFEECGGIKQEGIIWILRSLKKLRFLKKVRLGCPGYHQQALKELEEGVVRLPGWEIHF